MAYDYSSESKLLELPNPYQLQNRLLWLCAAVLLLGGIPACSGPARRCRRARCGWWPGRSSRGWR